MKIVVLSCLIAVSSAFVVPSSPSLVSTKSALSMSSVNADDWIGKPLTAPKDTPSTAARRVSWIEKQTMEDVMIEPDYFLTWAVAGLGPLIIWYHSLLAPEHAIIGLMGGLFHMLFAALLWVQTRRVRCVFEKDAFEFYNIKGTKLDFDEGAYLQKKPDNYVSGTVNRWKYDQIINWGFFPSMEFPVICYFKETETPEAQWDKWFAAFDSYGRGQPHFFPGIVNVRQFKDEMEARGVKRKQVPSFKSKK